MLAPTRRDVPRGDRGPRRALLWASQQFRVLQQNTQPIDETVVRAVFVGEPVRNGQRGGQTAPNLGIGESAHFDVRSGLIQRWDQLIADTHFVVTVRPRDREILRDRNGFLDPFEQIGCGMLSCSGTHTIHYADGVGRQPP